MSMAARALGLPPGVTFRPESEQLVRLYLLPRAWGYAAATTGVVIEADGTGTALPPWELLARHGRTEDGEAYFFDRTDENSRSCGGNKWTWVSQRRTPDQVLVLPGGEEVSWNKRNFNLHPGRKRSSSTGWVMHEYTITSPPCPFPIKLCHVVFSGQGPRRQRMPHNGDAAGPSLSEASTTTVVDQELLLPPLEQDQERVLISNCQQPHGVDQEQLQIYQGSSSSVLTCSGSEVGSSQEFCAGNQESILNGQQPYGFSQEHRQIYQEPSALTCWDSGVGSSQETCAGNQELLLPLGQDQESFLNQQQPHGFDQEQLQCYEGSSQDTCPGQKELADSQQQSQDYHLYAYGALLASDTGASQEPAAGRDLTPVPEQEVNRLPGNEEPCTTPPLMDQRSPEAWPWDDLDTFCQVPGGYQSDCDGGLVADTSGTAFQEQGTM